MFALHILSRLSPLLLLVALLALGGCTSSPAPAVSIAPTVAPPAVPTTAPPTVSDTPRPAPATPAPTAPTTPTRAATAAVTRVVPTAVPTKVYSSGPPKYLWPTDTRGSFIRPGLSWATDKALFLTTTDNPPDGITWVLQGGAKSDAPLWAARAPAPNTTVRGHPATFVSGLLVWEEDGQPYGIQGVKDQQRAEAIAAGLEEVPLATWRARVADVGTPRAPNSRLLYFWPTWLPEGVRVSTGFRATFADDGFMFVLVAGSGERVVGLQAGPSVDLIQLPQTAGTHFVFRGQPAQAVPTDRGIIVKWTENDIPYRLSTVSISPEDTLAVLKGLETVDLATWRQRVSDLP